MGQSDDRKAVTVGPWTVEELFGPDEDGNQLLDVRHQNRVLSSVMTREDLRDLMVAAWQVLGVERIEPA